MSAECKSTNSSFIGNFEAEPEAEQHQQTAFGLQVIDAIMA